MLLSVGLPFYLYHCIRTILSVPFCLYHFVHTILSVPFCPYHFVHTILSATILSKNRSRVLAARDKRPAKLRECCVLDVRNVVFSAQENAHNDDFKQMSWQYCVPNR